MRNGQDVPSTLDPALSDEWLLANGIGGTASGTAAGACARRTHALLTATRDHARPVTLLLRVDERALTPSGPVELGAAFMAGGAQRPTGHRLIESFRREPWPAWRYRVGETKVEKSVMMVDGHHAVIIGYRHLEGPALRLSVSPLVAARDLHSIQREHAGLRGVSQGLPGRVRIEFGADDPPLTVWHNGAFLPARLWHRQVHYPLDAVDSGAPEYEDVFVPGHIEGGLGPGESMFLVASTESDLFRALAAEDRFAAPPPRSLAECVQVLESEKRARLAVHAARAVTGADFTARQAAAAHGREIARRRAPLVDHAHPWVTGLAAALESGLVARGARLGFLGTLPGAAESPIAALRAVPALVALRSFDDARQVLAGIAEYLDEGLAPSAFAPEDGTPLYDSAETALWLVAAADVYARRSEDMDYVRDVLYGPLESIMQYYRGGTRGVRAGDSGLLETPENGAWVARADLNILWYHALVAMAQLARLTGRRENGAFYLAWARAHQTRFHDALWDVRRGALLHGVGPAGDIPGIEPAHALAVSLAPALVTPDRAASLVDALERELFTPYGMLDEPGGTVARPEALGAFLTAYLRVANRDVAAQVRVRGWLETLRTRGVVSGVPGAFRLARDGSWSADGTWSPLAAGELLRVVVEELDPADATLGAEDVIALAAADSAR
ncbi:MAG TPA: glycogen debranching enzyme N-terminal domain-containing protein [Candidatus Saccharimonadaceae bacterium]|jgi:glycogen debranching enzyme|nr:glycogen debranching enzyme N-terminal domain-containing protein [Candidatus Saccharimonadaceae bacterium]